MATGTILDDEPGISIDDVSVGEADGSAGFTVTLSASSLWTVTVDYAAEDITAVAGSDYSEAEGTLTFAPGATEQPLAVAVTDDSFDESDETFRVVLSDPFAAGLARAAGTATIVDDDEAATLVVEGATVSEHDGEVRVAVKLTSASATEVRVLATTEDLTARAGADYSTISQEVVFAPGAKLQRVTVPILDDDMVEDAETFLVRLSSAQNAQIAIESATVTIQDNDTRSSIVIGDETVSESAGVARLTVRLAPARSTAVTVDWATEDITATAGADYTAASATVTFDPGETEQTIDVMLLDDALEEADETFRVRLGTPSGDASLARNTAEVTILDDEGAASLTVTDAVVSESAATARVRVALSPASDEVVMVSYATSDGTATAGEDYVAGADKLTILAGETEKYIEVSILDDLMVEGIETFAVTLSEPAGAELSRAAAEVTIEDDDLALLSVSDVSVLESDARAVFTLSLDPASTRPVRVQYASADGTATAGEDYLPASGVLVLDPGERSGTVEVTVIDDARAEEDETFTLALSGASGAGASRPCRRGHDTGQRYVPAARK